MKYAFNSTRFAELMTERKLKKTNVARMLGRSQSYTVQNWMNGEKIESTHIVEICNIFDINPAEFFLLNGRPIVEPTRKTTSNISKDSISDTPSANMQQQMQFINEKAELEKKHLQAISTLEKEHLRELMQKEVDLARRESDIREEIRREMRDEYESQIATLRNQLIDLTTQYRELEILGGRGPITAVAECKGSNYMAGKK